MITCVVEKLREEVEVFTVGEGLLVVVVVVVVVGLVTGVLGGGGAVVESAVDRGVLLVETGDTCTSVFTVQRTCWRRLLLGRFKYSWVTTSDAGVPQQQGL